MALPTLRPYYRIPRPSTSAETRIARRREQEEGARQQWAHNSSYFTAANVRASRQEAWASSRSIQCSMTAYERSLMAEDKKRKLQTRREKLRELLDKENKEYEAELKSLSPNQFSTMRERADYLKSKREKERKELADEKLYDHWRSNCPDLREVESAEVQKHVVSEWGRQKERREQELETARQEKKSYELGLEEARLAGLKAEQVEQQRQKQEQKDHSEALRAQMREIKRREKEAAALEHQQAQLLAEQAELQRAEDSRKLMEERQKKTELRRFLAHQCKAQLRRRSQQVQEALELDLAILEDLTEKEKEEQALATSRRERAHADVLWMREMVAKQLEVERQRELELDNLYREEAARLWQKRDADWEKERRAQKKLMNEVFEERQRQIDMKLEVLKEEQAQSIKERERLIEELEVEAELERAEATARQRQRELVTEGWSQQVKDKRRSEGNEHTKVQQEIEEKRLAEESYAAHVREEERLITNRGFAPKDFARKKIAWN